MLGLWTMKEKLTRPQRSTLMLPRLRIKAPATRRPLASAEAKLDSVKLASKSQADGIFSAFS